MILSKLKPIAVAIVASLVAVGGVRTFALQQHSPAQPAEAPPAGKPADPSQALSAAIAGLRTDEAKLKADLASTHASLRDVETRIEALQKRLADASRPAKPATAPLANGPAPKVMSLGNTYFAVTPEGDKVAVHSLSTNQTKSVRLAEPGEGRREVVPYLNQQFLALQIKGPKVDRVAVLNYGDMKWYPQDLREPVTDAMPIVSMNSVTYSLGRRVYAFSTQAKTWGVLELPEGAKANAVVGFGSCTVEHDGHIYTFRDGTGTWADFNSRTILDGPDK